MEQLEWWAELVAKFSNPEFPKEDFLGAALRLEQLEKSEGKPYEILAEEYEKTKEHLGQLTANVDSLAVKKQQLLKEIDPLSQKVSTLTKEKGDRES